MDAVVFDLGAVCIDWDPRYLYRTMFDGDDVAMEYFLAEVCSQEWNAQMDEGRPWAEAIELLSIEYPESRTHIIAFRERWEEMLGEPIHGTVEILERLQAAGIATYALSNWSAETFPIAVPRYPFLSRFDGVVISGREGVRKPDPSDLPDPPRPLRPAAGDDGLRGRRRGERRRGRGRSGSSRSSSPTRTTSAATSSAWACPPRDRQGGDGGTNDPGRGSWRVSSQRC